jgi:putative FmdB family regulatory protein
VSGTISALRDSRGRQRPCNAHKTLDNFSILLSIFWVNLRRPIAIGEEVRIMPTYEFKCEKCKKRFELIMTVSEYDSKKIRCPKCKSTRVRQQISSFQTITSKKS